MNHEVMGVSSGALGLHGSMKRALGVADILDDICTDNKITRDEERAFRDCLDTFDRLLASIISIKIAHRDGELVG